MLMKFYKYLFLVCVLIGFGFKIEGQNIIVKPYLQDSEPISISIMWETDNIGLGYVDWGSSPFGLSITVTSSSIVGNGNTRIHVALINGLAPNTKYYYKVRTFSGVLSQLYNFKTLPLKSQERSVNFVAVSDMQRDGGNPGVFKNMVKIGIIPVTDTALINGFYGLDGIIIPGDLVQTGGNYASWRTDFFNLSDSLTPYVPIYPVPGNHEYYSGGLPNFLKYFTLPLNGSVANPEEWWYKDFSNIRLIGLNSNSPMNDMNTQLSWIETVLTDAGNDPNIDFVFAQLHHPYKSELWLPGELGFTGNVIEKLETFTTTYNKPSLHFFGHTHAYSRGQSRDHNHLWVNVATAGGAIDNWGEFPNADYDEFVISEDDYGFVMMEVEAGLDPSFKMRRFSRGDQNVNKDNKLSDEILIKRYGIGPIKPQGIYPLTDSIFVDCVKLKASVFNDFNNSHQASHWQIVEGCDFTGSGVTNRWKQNENWYNEVDTQANDDLTDESISSLLPNKQYCWRVRYRNQNLVWSDWSTPLSFLTKVNNSGATSNLLLNNGAESGITSWTGDIESLNDNECNSVPVYAGLKFFAVGGVCTGEQNIGIASQLIKVVNYATEIDNGNYSVEFKAFMRGYAVNNDKPEMYIEFLDVNNILISTTATISSSTASWTEKSQLVLIPSGTRNLKVVLKGTRLAGSDNDSYFDELSIKLFLSNCPTCIGSNMANAVDLDNDGYCANIDCNDSNPNIYPGALETCDGIDNNCDGLTDSGVTVTWTGNGDGKTWTDGTNWNQMFPPLACQHVILSTVDSVKLSTKVKIKSLFVAQSSILKLDPNAELMVEGFDPGSSTSILVNGYCKNEGRIFVDNSTSTGLKINGLVQNLGNIIVRKSANNDDILVLPLGKLENNLSIEIK